MKTVFERTRPKAASRRCRVGKALVAACALLLALLAVLSAILTGGGKTSPGSEGTTDGATFGVIAALEGEAGMATGAEGNADSDGGDAGDDAAPPDEGVQAGAPGAEAGPVVNSEPPSPLADSASESPPAPSEGESAEAGESHEGSKNWVEDVERVWVVDKAAWTEMIPIYETVERSICNICGADITGDTSAHSKQHMLAGEGSGYHSEVIRVQTETRFVDHPEEGHWEIVSTGGHWE